MDENPTYLTGQLLLALPGMGDPRFERSVIAICVHDAGGAMGVEIAREHDEIGFTDVLEQILPEQAGEDAMNAASGTVAPRDLLMGGPMEPQRGFVIHSLDYESADTISIAGRYGLSSTPRIVVDMGLDKGPKRAALALGYAGWGPGQLDEELKRNGWLVLDIETLPLIDVPPEQRWRTALESAGIDPSLLSGQFGSA